MTADKPGVAKDSEAKQVSEAPGAKWSVYRKGASGQLELYGLYSSKELAEHVQRARGEEYEVAERSPDPSSL